MADDAKPAVFIGSSSEGLKLAYAIEQRLVDVAHVDVWKNGLFGLGEGYLEVLVSAVERFDFAVLVLTADDVIESRGQTAGSPRDNVLFELGLFMGRLGRFRTFAVCEQGTRLKLPSDLAGVTVARLVDRPDDVNATVSPACTAILHQIEQRGRLQQSDRHRELAELRTRVESLQTANNLLKVDLDSVSQLVGNKERDLTQLEKEVAALRSTNAQLHEQSTKANDNAKKIQALEAKLKATEQQLTEKSEKYSPRRKGVHHIS